MNIGCPILRVLAKGGMRGCLPRDLFFPPLPKGTARVGHPVFGLFIRRSRLACGKLRSNEHRVPHPSRSCEGWDARLFTERSVLPTLAEGHGKG